MEFIAYVYLFLLVFTALFIVVVVTVEKNVKEDTSFMKWWRKHVIDKYPYDEDL